MSFKIAKVNMMQRLKTLVVLILVAFLLDFTNAQAKTQVTCTGGTFSVGETPCVTCNFHKNISVTKHGINIMRYPTNASGLSQGTDVLQCVWPSKTSGSPVCVLEKGYKFDFVVTDHLRLEVSSGANEVSGFYVCHVVPKDDFESHACDLVVAASGKTATIQTPRKPEIREEYTTTTRYTTQNPTSADVCESQTTGLAILGCISGVLALIVSRPLWIGVFCWMKSIKQQADDEKSTKTHSRNRSRNKNVPYSDIFDSDTGKTLKDESRNPTEESLEMSDENDVFQPSYQNRLRLRFWQNIKRQLHTAEFRKGMSLQTTRT